MSMKQSKSQFVFKKSSFILGFLLFSLLIDILNGFLVAKFSLQTPISQVYKLLILAFFLYSYTIKEYKESYFIITLLFFLVFTISTITINFNSILFNTNIFSDLIYSLKTLSLIIVYFGAVNIVKHYQISEENILMIYKIIFYVIFVSLILSIFGYGETQYGENSDGQAFGYKGYFFAGNELTSLFSLSYVFTLYSVISYQPRYYKTVTCTIIAIVCAMLLATKTAMLSYVIITLLLPVLLVKKLKINKMYNSLNNIKLFYISFIPLFSIALMLLYDRILIIIERLSFLFTQQGESFTGFLLSGRASRYESLYNIYNQMNVVDALFGIGRESYVNFTYGIHLRFSAEMDLFDSLFAHGIIGTLMMYSFWCYLLLRAFKLYRTTHDTIIVPQMLITTLLFFNSFIAGHIFAASMVMIFYGFSTAKSLNK
ncbi:O-antigen ligase family protein [Photobacterium leiognathi]|uniref:O-antigen ligase family protein n=1 Tax=Photobacterium leiognathi TaxID=553611 RepID=UPI0029820DF1|nr:O-antigen ligase family protein [Photobacterium leiognathi]